LFLFDTKKMVTNKCLQVSPIHIELKSGIELSNPIIMLNSTKSYKCVYVICKRRSNMAQRKKLTIELMFIYDSNEVKNIIVRSPFKDKVLHDRIVELIIEHIKQQLGLTTTPYIQ